MMILTVFSGIFALLYYLLKNGDFSLAKLFCLL